MGSETNTEINSIENLPDDVDNEVHSIIKYTIRNPHYVTVLVHGIQKSYGEELHVYAENAEDENMEYDWNSFFITECPDYHDGPCKLSHCCGPCGNITTGYCCEVCEEHGEYNCDLEHKDNEEENDEEQGEEEGEEGEDEEIL